MNDFKPIEDIWLFKSGTFESFLSLSDRFSLTPPISMLEFLLPVQAIVVLIAGYFVVVVRYVVVKNLAMASPATLDMPVQPVNLVQYIGVAQKILLGGT